MHAQDLRLIQAGLATSGSRAGPEWPWGHGVNPRTSGHLPDVYVQASVLNEWNANPQERFAVAVTWPKAHSQQLT